MRIKLTLACLLLLAVAAQAQFAPKKYYHPFTGTLAFTVEGGATMAFTDYPKSDPDFAGRAALEYWFPLYSHSAFGFRTVGEAGYFNGKASDNSVSFRTNYLGAGANVVFGINLGDVLFPYFSGGAMYTMYSPTDKNGVYLFSPRQKNELSYTGEFGLRFIISDNMSLNLGASAHLSPNDSYDGKTLNNNNDMFVSGFFGFTVSFFGSHDSDGDGVDDDKDMCPDTPRHVKVDEFGCPLDSDKDGIPDYLDQCPDTPDGVKVDKRGCPLDGDGDGVPDYLDICPGTPRGVSVDEYGCPKDSDGDGVPDYLDLCPNSPKNVPVDKNGCPLDTDGDGVPDYLDQCPNTPAGTQVDATGCTIRKEQIVKEVPVIKDLPQIKPMVLSGGTSFAPGKSVLQSAAYAELDRFVAIMHESPSSRWVVEGHTDNKGNYQKNKKLSYDRAASVVKYFVSKGISKDRFTVRGLGSDFPVADNATDEGRAKNRRVVILRAD